MPAATSAACSSLIGDGASGAGESGNESPAFAPGVSAGGPTVVLDDDVVDSGTGAVVAGTSLGAVSTPEVPVGVSGSGPFTRG